MSSTNRSKTREDHIADYYVTPLKDVELFLKEFNKRINLDWNNAKIVDCCAGGNAEVIDENGRVIDVEHSMSYPIAINNVFGDVHINTYDIRKDSFAEFKQDYLTTKLDYEPNIIITNPPFNIAISVIEKALSDVKEDGYVIVLLRLNFFGSKERKPFFDKYMPEWCFVHHIRIGFLDKKDSDGYVIIDDKTGLPKRGNTDSIEYAHFVFKKGYKPDFTKLVII
jgi:hypothetical protein